MNVDEASMTFRLASYKYEGFVATFTIIELSAAFLGENGCDNIATMS